MGLPPVWVRRLVFAPIIVLLAFLVVTTLPVWLLVAAAAFTAVWIPGVSQSDAPGYPAATD